MYTDGEPIRILDNGFYNVKFDNALNSIPLNSNAANTSPIAPPSLSHTVLLNSIPLSLVSMTLKSRTLFPSTAQISCPLLNHADGGVSSSHVSQIRSTLG